jgi:PAS domain S-box-containing protein
MRSRSHTPLPPPHAYTPDIDRLHQQLTALTARWRGVAPLPPSLAEAVEALATTVEELHAINEDLTRSQQAALETQQRYQELFEGVPEVYLVTDLQGVIQEANRTAAHRLHLDRSQLAGLPLVVLIACDMRRSFQTQLAWLRNGAEVREWVIRVQPRHRAAVPMVCQVAPARNVAGQLIGFRWLLRDLTASHQVQETLEQRVRELTAALTHAQETLQAMRDEAEVHKREFNHRMKNHLQVVASLLNWRAQDLQDLRACTLVAACQGRLRAIALVHELLSRAGDVERLELGAYLRRLALLLFEVYGIDRERIRLTLQAAPVTMALDTAIPCGLLVHEVLSNCMQHAFPGDQGGDIAITLRAEPAGEVTLTIRDTGIGLPAGFDDRQENSFGLHLIRGLTERLQGTLVFTHGHGTCVTLRFPI